MSERVALVLVYEVDDLDAGPDGVLGPMVHKLRADGYLGRDRLVEVSSESTYPRAVLADRDPGVSGVEGARLVAVYGAIREHVARVTAVFDQDETVAL